MEKEGDGNTEKKGIDEGNCISPDTKMVESVFNMLDMQKDKNIPIQSRKNCVTILGVDLVLSGKIKYNTLSNRKNVEGALPWNKSDKLREWTNIDSEYLIYYIETYYLIGADKKILSALEIVADTNKFNPFIDMLNDTQWDGVNRIDNLLTDYLGIVKNEYSVQCIRLLMLAVISRAFCPGTKYDYVLVLSGPQGIGKSTFFMKLCCNEDWYLENLRSIDKGKEAAEQIQGKLIVELNELLAIKGALEGVKSFVTAKSDDYRGAYARESEKRYRTCVFVGTTNNSQYLEDKTGNRRFLPLECGSVPVTKTLFADDDMLRQEFMQAWAEAYQIYLSGKFSLTLPKSLSEYVEKLQKDFEVDEPLIGIIQKFLDTYEDDYVCNKIITSKTMGIENPDRKTLNNITDIMNNKIVGWKKEGTHRFKGIGQQKCYVRIQDFTNAEDLEIPFE